MNELSPSQRLTSLLDAAPLKPIQRWLWVLATGGTLLDGFAIFALGVAMPLIIAQFDIKPDLVGFIGAALVLGAVLGAGIGGPVADHVGRKRLMLADMLIITAGAVASALANTAAILFIGQLLVGIGIGIDFPVSSTYVSEIFPSRSRARMMVATIACQSIGMLLAATITLLWLSSRSSQSWRFFLASEGAIASLFFLLRLSAPDSPHWLMLRGKLAKAGQVFGLLMPDRRETVLQLVRDAQAQRPGTAPSQTKPSGATMLFSAAYRARTALVAIPWFLMDIATYGVGLFTPVILGAISAPGQAGGLVPQDFSAARGSAVIDVFLLVGFVAGIWAVPRFGRIRMQIIGFGGMTAGMLLLLIAVNFSNSTLHIPLVFAGFILFNFLMNAGPNSTTFTLAPILFPTQLRATASGFAASVAKLGATFGVFVMPILKAKFGVPGILSMIGAVSALALIVTWVYGREDKE